jgi:hypothetical protein
MKNGCPIVLLVEKKCSSPDLPTPLGLGGGKWAKGMTR